MFEGELKIGRNLLKYCVRRTIVHSTIVPEYLFLLVLTTFFLFFLASILLARFIFHFSNSFFVGFLAPKFVSTRGLTRLYFWIMFPEQQMSEIKNITFEANFLNLPMSFRTQNVFPNHFAQVAVGCPVVTEGFVPSSPRVRCRRIGVEVGRLGNNVDSG